MRVAPLGPGGGGAGRARRRADRATRRALPPAEEQRRQLVFHGKIIMILRLESTHSLLNTSSAEVT